MAHKKAGGSTALGRDSIGKRLGVKLQDGQIAKPGCILIRQRGTKYHPGKNVRRGKDDTLYSETNGMVKFSSKKMKKFNGALKRSTVVSVVTE
ncbi:MAG: 50S ribosomal protein L27 [Patescibacteria group bacterium]|nr:MAG: 50S ribosomal protein L27 [Patescibacteria group bacterium]